ncbi:MarR family winged helix-turn-helix transcriptional regulator [Brevibacterium sp. 50QC2O2]|nr:MarR family transcriptional regulator [Brevibacterium sp. 50QC2O2]
MTGTASRDHEDPVAKALYRPRPIDPATHDAGPIGRAAAESSQVDRLMRALAELRTAERVVLEASEKYMKLSAQDMRAVHYLIAAKRIGQIVTPGMIATHLEISAASTTKLLNRLERGGHVVRRVHPVDRRAFAIEVTPATENLAKQTIGRQHARRLNAVLGLTPDERETVIGFLHDMAAELSLSNADWA